MAEHITGAKQLINDRGGYRVVADSLGWPASTVHTFWRKDSAPKYRWDVIQLLPFREKPERKRRAKSDQHQQEAA